MPRRDLARRLAAVTRELSELLEVALTPSGKANKPIAEAILEALAGGPLKASALAERAGYPYNSRFRAAMTDLARRGVVVRTPDGYALPS